MEQVYLEQPLSFINVDFPNHVFKLTTWYDRLRLDNGFKMQYGHNLFH